VSIVETELPGVVIIPLRSFGDARGHFMELFQAERYRALGLTQPFVQDNFSRSVKGTLRGLHFQEPRPQGKLVQVLSGRVWDVAVDIRRGSPHFGRWIGVELSADEPRQLWIPPGFAHGFCVLSESADFYYKCTDVYVPEADAVLRWDDPELGIAWPVQDPLLSPKDAGAPLLKDAPRLPRV
jgi:dTDP-4-dehydrorhamnose 3,5-epimerase